MSWWVASITKWSWKAATDSARLSRFQLSGSGLGEGLCKFPPLEVIVSHLNSRNAWREESQRRVEGELGFWELHEALIFGNRFAQMQIDISLAWYALAFVSCQEQGWMKQESTPFGITPVLQPAQSLSTINSICWPHSPFHPPLFYFQKNHREHRSYSSFQKAASNA